MQLVLDIGSGKSLPDYETAKRVIDSVAAIDTRKHEIVFKAQLFEDIPPNEPLDRDVFRWAQGYACEMGYGITASVFDENSLDYLLGFHDIPFVKIAAPTKYHYLIDLVPRGIPVYVSNHSRKDTNLISLACISKYPAPLEEYMMIPWIAYYDGVSDHTEGWDLYKLLQPDILEKHFVLERSPANPDSGPFACTIKELEEIM